MTAISPQSSAFVHLHVHSEYSVLDGATRIDDLCRRTLEDGSSAIALTDHGVMFGSLEFYNSAKKHGLTPIIGVEAYMAPLGRLDRSKRSEAHVTLLAADEEGYYNLIKLVSIGHTEGFYYKPRIDIDVLAKHNAGIICLSGCLSGLVQDPLMRGDYATAKANAQAYKDIFGDRFYLELMRHGIADQQAVEAGMFALEHDLKIPLVATNDSHYLEHEHHAFHDVLTCIGTQQLIADEKRFRLPGDQFFLKTPQEMRAVFADVPRVCDTTLEIAKRVNISLEPKGFHIPTYPVPQTKQLRGGPPLSPQHYLRKLATAGLKKRYGSERIANEPGLTDRLNFELNVIERMGFSSYFLIVWDFIKYARDNDIPVGPGRGSAVGSIVSYCLGITALDPIRFGLIFERFLNPSRVSMPDIDTDFCIEGRAAVIKYVTEKYGADRVAGISIFGTMASRGAIRNAGRVLGIDLKITDVLAKLVPSGPKGLTVAQAREHIPEIKALEETDPKIAHLMDMAANIEGFVRNPGTHAAGIVIADAPLTQYVPLIRVEAKSTGAALDDEVPTTINTQYEMNLIESIGLVKMDFLGLRNLTTMRTAEKEIQRTLDPTFDLRMIPDDDKTTYDMLVRGNTGGVFQLESDGMTKMLVDMRPDRLEDIVAAVALYRPGPMDWIPQYIAGKHKRIETTYLHPKLEPILAETHGVACYQEQVMEIAKAIAGFSLSEADELRKVMGKKQKDKIGIYREKFLAGAATANGINEDLAAEIFAFIEPFAGYGFNKSHAVAYGWIAYQTAYLKANYPLAYLAALLSSVRKETAKLVDYLEDTRRQKIEVDPPDINRSLADFAVIDKSICFGFGAVRGLENASVSNIIQERFENGAYQSLFDLVTRTRRRGVHKKTLESLIKVGACDSLDGHRAAKLASLDTAFDRANLDLRDTTNGQMTFLTAVNDKSIVPQLANVPPATRVDELMWEREGLGIYVSGHPVDDARTLLDAKEALSIADAKHSTETNVYVGGMLGPVKRIKTKAGNQMLVATVEDRSGAIEVVLYSSNYETYQADFVETAIVAVAGQLRFKQKPSTDDDDTETPPEKNVIVNRIDIIVPAVKKVDRALAAA